MKRRSTERTSMDSLTMGKSRGDRRVIFSSSGAIPTIHDLRRPRINFVVLVLWIQFKGGNRDMATEEGAIKDVDEVKGGEGVKIIAVFGVEAGIEIESDRKAISGGA